MNMTEETFSVQKQVKQQRVLIPQYHAKIIRTNGRQELRSSPRSAACTSEYGRNLFIHKQKQHGLPPASIITFLMRFKHSNMDYNNCLLFNLMYHHIYEEGDVHNLIREQDRMKRA